MNKEMQKRKGIWRWVLLQKAKKQRQFHYTSSVQSHSRVYRHYLLYSSINFHYHSINWKFWDNHCHQNPAAIGTKDVLIFTAPLDLLLILMTAVGFWASIRIIYMCVCVCVCVCARALPSCFIKERNKVSTASVYCCTGARGMADSKDGWLWRRSA